MNKVHHVVSAKNEMMYNSIFMIVCFIKEPKICKLIQAVPKDIPINEHCVQLFYYLNI